VLAGLGMISAWGTTGSREEIAAPQTVAMMMINALVKSPFRGEGILGRYLKETIYCGISQLC
jgi:hypothetical protein